MNQFQIELVSPHNSEKHDENNLKKINHASPHILREKTNLNSINYVPPHNLRGHGEPKSTSNAYVSPNNLRRHGKPYLNRKNRANSEQCFWNYSISPKKVVNYVVHAT